MRPPSQTALPAMLWPPPRTARSSFSSRASLTASMTSAAPQAARDERRAAVDHGVPDRAGGFVAVLTRQSATSPRILPRKRRKNFLRDGPRRVERADRQIGHVRLRLRGQSQDLRAVVRPWRSTGRIGEFISRPRFASLVHELNRPGIDSELAAALRRA